MLLHFYKGSKKMSKFLLCNGMKVSSKLVVTTIKTLAKQVHLVTSAATKVVTKNELKDIADGEAVFSSLLTSFLGVNL